MTRFYRAHSVAGNVDSVEGAGEADGPDLARFPDHLLLRDNAELHTKRLVRRLERLAHKVTLEPLPLSA